MVSPQLLGIIVIILDPIWQAISDHFFIEVFGLQKCEDHSKREIEVDLRIAQNQISERTLTLNLEQPEGQLELRIPPTLLNGVHQVSSPAWRIEAIEDGYEVFLFKSENSFLNQMKLFIEGVDGERWIDCPIIDRKDD